MAWAAIDLAAVAAAFGLGGLVVWLGFVRSAHSRVAAARKEAEYERAQRQQLAEEKAAAEVSLETERQNHAARVEKLVEEKVAAEVSLKTERQIHAARVEELERMGAEIERKFVALAAEALEKNNNSFLNLVTERFEKHKASADEDLARRQQAIETLVKPIGEGLTKFERKVGEIEKAREGAYRAVTEQVKTITEGQLRLKTETSRLVQALRQPKTRGRWGEYQLRTVLEMAGMSEHVDFVIEPTIGEDGRQRPDAIVHMPGGKSVIVDAKTPLEAYLAAVEASDEEERARQHMDKHVHNVRDRVQELASQEYWRALPVTPEFVVMFIPGESFYSAAVEREPELFEQAVSNRVLIATPTILIALMKAIAYGWQQHKLAENTQDIVDLARKLFERIKVFGGHMDGLGRALHQAVDRYNKGVGSLEGRILPAVRKFENLGAAPQGSAIRAVVPVELEARALQAPELMEGRVEAAGDDGGEEGGGAAATREAGA